MPVFTFSSQSLQSPQRRPRAIFVKKTNEFGMDPNRTSNYCHGVLGQHARLVGTNNRCVGHGFARTQDADKRILVCHPLHFKSQGQAVNLNYNLVEKRDELLCRHTFQNGKPK
jgi:hypothetical protein